MATSTSTCTISQGVGKGGMETYTITHTSGTVATVYSHGATLTSVKTASDKELLFVSNSAVYDGSSPIRGGVPVVFPIFGDGWGGDGVPKGLPGHGFARRSTWKLAIIDDNVNFVLDSNAISEDFAASFPFKFALRYQLDLSAESFTTTLHVENQGTEAFEFQALLHTYYSIEAISAIKLNGYQGFSFVDKLTGGSQEPTESREVISITEETDRIYKAVGKGPFVIGGTGVSDTAASISVTIDTPDNSVDCVVWNPWIAKAARMKDFGDEEYLNMICVEPGYVAEPKILPGSGKWHIGVTSLASSL